MTKQEVLNWIGKKAHELPEGVSEVDTTKMKEHEWRIFDRNYARCSIAFDIIESLEDY